MAKVCYNQSGYDGCSMSMNARLAYRRGEMPKSRWTKAAMLDALRDACAEAGIEWDGRLEHMTKAELFGRFFEWKSWHHTGKYATETDFYGVAEDKVAALAGKGEPWELD